MLQPPFGSEIPDVNVVLSVPGLWRRGRGMLESSTEEVGRHNSTGNNAIGALNGVFHTIYVLLKHTFLVDK